MDVPEVNHRTRSHYSPLHNEKRKRGWPLFFFSVRNFRFGVLLIAASLSASTITISDSDTFSSTTGSSAFSGPDETYSFSFVVNTTPGVSNVDPGNYFDVDFSDFTYTLDGSPVTITPVDIRFFNASQLGGFEICFTTACSFFDNPIDGFVFIGQLGRQMYSDLSPRRPCLPARSLRILHTYMWIRPSFLSISRTRTRRLTASWLRPIRCRSPQRS